MKRLAMGTITLVALLAGCGKPGVDDTSAADGAINIDHAKVTATALPYAPGQRS